MQTISFQERFTLSKYHKVWLGYEWFSVLCNTLLPIESLLAETARDAGIQKKIHTCQTTNLVTWEQELRCLESN